MAAGNYSGTKAELEEYEQVRRMEERHVEFAPDGEREEIRQIFQAKGFRGEALDSAVDVITATRERWIDTMMTEEHGLPPISRSPAQAALRTFFAFLLCGSIPLAPFAISAPNAVLASIVMTGGTFFLIGSFRSRWSPVPWWRAGLETFLIGAAAACLAYLAGVFVASLIGQTP
jgi:VIT1/CCC1 family predicted Fe2+/Mn2+ transporter